MSLDYAKYLHLPIKTLKEPRRLFNVNGTPNRTGDLKYYMDLTTRTGQSSKTLRYFLSDLGDNKVILGYPWFVAAQPKIDWARGWIAHDQLPIILRASDATKARFVPQQGITRRAILTKSTLQIPPQYKDFVDVFTPRKGAGMPPLRPWDHEIELKPGAPATLRSKLIRLS
jgi:hypothetical protein